MRPRLWKRPGQGDGNVNVCVPGISSQRRTRHFRTTARASLNAESGLECLMTRCFIKELKLYTHMHIYIQETMGHHTSCFQEMLYNNNLSHEPLVFLSDHVRHTGRHPYPRY